MITKQKKIQHLYLRAGFGETPGRVNNALASEIPHLVDELFKRSDLKDDLTALKNPVRGKEASNLKIALLLLRSKKQVKELNLAWMEKMANSPAQLREKMTLFWHNHFATKVPFAYLAQVQNNTLRHHALGSFRELLHAVAKDPAMLIFLNNQQNRERSPNENFARELMELFTLGEGYYTEQDIKEAARAFTGWQVNKAGKFEFNSRQHDFGSKTVFGQTGDWNGDDVIDIILNNPRTAKFLTQKIYAYFVNDDVNAPRVEELGQLFFKSDYDISSLLAHIFTSDWFYEEENTGNKIASPVELLVRYRRLFSLELTNDELWLKSQKILGQVLFNPPNVAGWPGGQNWIDSSSLMFRLNLAPLFFEYERVDPWAGTKADWSGMYGAFSTKSKEELVREVTQAFIQADTSSKDDLLMRHITGQDPEAQVKSAVVRTMMLPEFQLI